MKPVRSIIFDLDGTLVDTLEDITASVNFTLTKLGVKPLPRETVRQYVGDGVDVLLMRALGDRVELLADARGVYDVHHSRNLVVRTRLYPNVAATLEYFKALPLAVVTNKAREFSLPILEQLGISGYFRTLIGAENGLPLKPAPDALLRIMREFGVAAADTVMVGDGTTDLLAGKAAGVATCAIAYGFRPEEALRALGPDYVVHDFGELRDLFSPEAAQ